MNGDTCGASLSCFRSSVGMVTLAEPVCRVSGPVYEW